MTTLLVNIKKIVGVQHPQHPLRGDALSVLPSIDNGWIRVEDDVIAGFGEMSHLPDTHLRNGQVQDVSGKMILPAWCDSHTHLVFASSREEEFVDKIRGMSYADIAAKGGGILNSARKLNEMSEDELFQKAWNRLENVIKMGTGAIEIKSGYGLSLEGEIKMLRVIRKLKEKSSIPIKSTFLGAHAIPANYKDNRDEYIRLIIEEMLPVIRAEQLADYIDVFCEQGFFTNEETIRIVNAGKSVGLKAKIHANQLSASGAVETAVSLESISADHLEIMNEKAISALAHSNTIATMLPTAAFFLRMQQPPARELIQSGCAVALASDYNPGSSPSGNMNLVVSMASIQLKMLPEEAINAATINGAFAMELAGEVGSIAVGKKANLILTRKIPSLAYLPYSFGEMPVDNTMIAGQWIQ